MSLFNAEIFFKNLLSWDYFLAALTTLWISLASLLLIINSINPMQLEFVTSFRVENRTTRSLSTCAVPWPEEVVHRVPPAFGQLLKGSLPPNPPTDTVVARMHAARVKPAPSSPFGLAIAERRVMNCVSRLLAIPHYPIHALFVEIPQTAYRSLRRQLSSSSVARKAHHFVKARRRAA
jgi:hypothetical protein